DGRTMFYIDTLAGASFWDVMSGTAKPGVDAFTLAPKTGQLSGRRRMFDIPVETPEPPQMTLPDGMTVDAEGSCGSRSPGAARSVDIHRRVRSTPSCTFRSPARRVSRSADRTSTISTSP